MPFFEPHFGEHPHSQCCTSRGSIHLLGSPSCLQFFWCKNRQKSGYGIRYQKKVAVDGVECKPTKSAKNRHLRGSYNCQTPILKSRSNFAPKTSRINGLVGHLTQSLNHDRSTNRVWVRARTVLRPRWMVTPSATLVGEC
mgnify:CR=1 FL=1